MAVVCGRGAVWRRAAGGGAGPRLTPSRAARRQVRDEVIHNVQATYKETDLFKVFQTGDLANLDELDPASAAKLPSLMTLRDALYSADFRA
ncbi:MAG: hypothetical protein J3K34DRAFT_222445 [Monoraphidium minutum]|nr:MAG: hypothetical protein J3K34DRAFT_222445 [Monoraphidium minutum]